jgi:hypothetical protein
MEHEARSCDYQSLLRVPVRGQLSHIYAPTSIAVVLVLVFSYHLQ